jgi:hypothetical protein
MLNRIYEILEEVLKNLDVGGEQSRAFELEIQGIKEILGYVKPSTDLFAECDRMDLLTRKLRRLAVESEGINAVLPTDPLEKWFDGTYEDTEQDMVFEKYDLAKLLRFIADVGVSFSE